MSDDLDSLWEQAKPISSASPATKQEPGMLGNLYAGGKHGFIQTMENTGDLLSHVPGLHALKTDPKTRAARDAEAQGALSTIPGKVGNFVGETIPSLAVGGLAGAGAKVAAARLLPQALARLAPLIATGAEGASQGAVLASPDHAEAGAGIGAALGVGGSVLSRALGKVAAPLASKLEDTGVSAGRRVLTNGADSLSRRQPVRADAVLEAIRSGAIRPFGTTSGALERLNGLAEEQGQQYGDFLRQLQYEGARGPNIGKTAAELRQMAGQARATNIGSNTPDIYLNASERLSALGEPYDHLSLTQAETIKRNLQAMAKYHRVGGDSLSEEAQKALASHIRQSIEDSVADSAANAPSGSNLPALAQDFVPIKQRLGRLLEAQSAAERGAARGAQRGALSPASVLVAAATPGGALKKSLAASVEHFMRTRGRSAVAAGAISLSDLLRSPSFIPATENLSHAGALSGLFEPSGTMLTPSMASDDNQDPRLKGQIAALRGER